MGGNKASTGPRGFAFTRLILMSAKGHERTSRHVRFMSVIPLKADIHRRGLHVRLCARIGSLRAPCREGALSR